jgi:hypothetical protein
MDSPLLSIPGAVAADPPDSGVPAHFGEPYAEQRALVSSVGLVDRGNRGVVTISGPDRLSWLHDLSSQHLNALPPHTASEALLLSAQGRVEHHMYLVDDGTTVWAHVEPGTAAGLTAFLESMRFMLRVEPADASDAYAVLTLGGPGAAALVPEGVVARTTGPWTDLFVPRERYAEIADGLVAAGARPAGMWAYEALRIAAHVPRLGVDTDERTIPHEVAWIGTAVHLDKGCYRGQETVARVHNLGRPPRRLVMLHLDGSVDRLPAPGSDVLLDGRRVGAVGSAQRHYELGPIALALVKRNTPVDAELLADGVAAAQEVVVSPDTGANVQVDLRRVPR